MTQTDAVYTLLMAQNFTQEAAQRIPAALLEWFAKHRRDLPWRARYHPYEVWISEVMLQQTQMERGVAYFQRWMERFPNVQAVAEASEDEIMRYWEGLGYYRRARFLHQAAKAIMERHGGSIPSSQEDLAALPGLGSYTASAILGIAFEQDIVPVDANVERVFSRLLDLDSPVKKKPASDIINGEAQRLLPAGHARNYDQALMEFGALVCGKAPKCQECPLTTWCASFQNGTQKIRPVTAARAETIPVTAAHGILICEKHVLLLQRDTSGLWGNMWEFPGADSNAHSPQQTVIRRFSDLGLDIEIIAPLGMVRHSYTNHRLTAHFFRVALEEKRSLKELSDILSGIPHRFIRWDNTDEAAMPAHHRKMAKRYFSSNPRTTAEQLHL